MAKRWNSAEHRIQTAKFPITAPKRLPFKPGDKVRIFYRDFGLYSGTVKALFMNAQERIGGRQWIVAALDTEHPVSKESIGIHNAQKWKLLAGKESHRRYKTFWVDFLMLDGPDALLRVLRKELLPEGRTY